MSIWAIVGPHGTISATSAASQHIRKFWWKLNLRFLPKESGGAKKQTNREREMGCRASKQGCCGENRPEELGKCAAVSPDVRWAWLRGRTLFTFYELRMLLKLFKAATYVSAQPGKSLAPFATMNEARPSELSADVKPGSQLLSTMDKAQFLSLCDSDETFRLSEVVGAFGSRLFDVLDEAGKGGLTFETFALGLSKLLKVSLLKTLRVQHSAVRGVFGNGCQVLAALLCAVSQSTAVTY